MSGETPSLDLSVVVITGGIGVDRKMLTACLDSVKTSCTHAGLSFEIIVIDNDCAPPLADWLPAQCAGVGILRFSPQVGFCRGNNAGYLRSRGRYLLQLNDDTELDIHAVSEVLRVFESHPAAGAVGPRLVNPDGSLQLGYYARTFPTMLDHLFQLFWINRLLPMNPVLQKHYLMAEDPDALREVDQPAGAALFYRREVLFTVGLLDEDYYFAMDDVDICTRIWERGWKIYYAPLARVVHYGGTGLRQSTFLSQSWLNGLLCFYRKNRSGPAFTWFRIMLIMAILFRMPLVTAVDLAQWIAGRKRGRSRGYANTLLRVLKSFVTPWQAPAWPGHDPQVVTQGEPYITRKEITV